MILMIYEAIDAPYTHTYIQFSFKDSYNGIKLQVKFTKHTYGTTFMHS